MRETLSKMHMHGIMMIDTIVFEIPADWIGLTLQRLNSSK